MRALLPSLILFVSSAVAAPPPIVLVEGRVAQYREAAAAAKKHLPGAEELEVDAPDAGQKLAEAPLIVPVGQRALALAREKAPNTPVVFCMVLGVTRASLAPNVTGVPLESDPAALLNHVRAIAPAAKRIGLVFNPSTSELLFSEASKAAGALGLTLVAKPVSTAADVRDAVSSMASSIDLLWLPADPRLFPKELVSFLLSFAAERTMPLVGFLDKLTEGGALASVSPDYTEIGERTGKLAAEILAKPEGKRVPLPPPVFAPGHLSLNLKTAKTLGIDISAKARERAKTLYNK